MMNSMYALVSNAVIVLFAMTLQFINSDSKLNLSKSSVTKTANEMKWNERMQWLHFDWKIVVHFKNSIR